MNTETITITVPKGSKITVDGVPYPTSTEVKLWTPEGDYWLLDTDGDSVKYDWRNDGNDRKWLDIGSIRPTREHIEALDRKRRAESIIFRYFYERGIDTRWKKGGNQVGVYINEDDGTTLDWTIGRHNFGSPFYVESKAIAEAAIANIPDAIRTALLGGWV